MSAKWFARPDGTIFQVVDITDRFADYGGFTEVPEPPTGGRDIWDAENETFIPYTPPPAPLDQRIAAAFGQLPAEMQIKYDSEVTRAAIYFQWQNLTMLSVVIAQAEAKLSLPDEQAVKDILDAAKAELGG